MMLIRICLVITFIFVSFGLIGCKSNQEEEVSTHIIIADNLRPEIRIIEDETVKQNNCSGTAEVEKEVIRTHGVVRTIEVGGGYQVHADGSVGISGTTIGLGTTIAAQYNLLYGVNDQVARGVVVKAAPRTHMEHYIRQVEIWEVGDVEVIVGDSSFIIPVEFRHDFDVQFIESREIRECPNNLVEATSLPATQLPTNNSTPTSQIPDIKPTVAPTSIGKISIPSNTNEGYTFQVTQNGKYTFRYITGAYSIFPINQIPAGQASWLTAIRIFKNRTVQWENDIAISNAPDLNFADYQYNMTVEEAIFKAEGTEATMTLNMGDYLTMAGVDEKPHYSDNTGEVVIEILFTPNE